jgi:hypothetical protein
VEASGNGSSVIIITGKAKKRFGYERLLSFKDSYRRPSSGESGESGERKAEGGAVVFVKVGFDMRF